MQNNFCFQKVLDRSYTAYVYKSICMETRKIVYCLTEIIYNISISSSNIFSHRNRIWGKLSVHYACFLLYMLQILLLK